MKGSTRNPRQLSIHRPNNIESMSNCRDPGIYMDVGSKKNIPTPYYGSVETLVISRGTHDKRASLVFSPTNYKFVGL